jgi:hypothetical protein
VIKNMKKAQVQQVFIYLMVLLVVGGILLIAIKIIPTIFNKACDVEMATFQSDLREFIEDSADFGDVTSDEISSPCGYDRLCILSSTFVQDTENAHVNAVTLIDNKDNIIASEIEVGTLKNVFLMKGNEIQPLFALDNILVLEEDGSEVICFNVSSGRFYLRLEGKGRGTVQVSKQE